MKSIDISLIGGEISPLDFDLAEHLFPPMSGAGFAHDLIEHQKGLQAIGTLDDELIAIGACWYTRGYFNDFAGGSGFISPYQVLAHDLSYLLDLHISGVPLRRRTSGHNAGTCGLNSDLQTVVSYARDNYHWQREDAAEIKQVEHFLAHAGALMVEGVNRQDKRFKDQLVANNVFNHVATAIDELINKPYQEHQNYTLFYSPNEAYTKPLNHY